MDAKEHQLSTVLDGQLVDISPVTGTQTIFTEDDERLSDVMDRYIPVQITYDQYMDMVKTGTINQDDKKFYIITDDNGIISIADSIVSRQSTFSSKKILELIAGGGTGGIILGPIKTTKTLFPEQWALSGSVYSYTLSVAGVTDSSLVTVNLSNSLSQEDYDLQSDVAQIALIKRIRQMEGMLILYAYGKVPTIPLVIDVTIQN